MTSYFNKEKFNQEELEWAISLIEAEFEIKERNTPEKMSKLIVSNFDVACTTHDIYKFFNIDENYERESNRIDTGYSDTYFDAETLGLDSQ